MAKSMPASATRAKSTKPLWAEISIPQHGYTALSTPTERGGGVKARRSMTAPIAAAVTAMSAIAAVRALIAM